MAIGTYCCEPFAELVGHEDEPIVSVGRDGKWSFNEGVIDFCPFCGTKIDYQPFNIQEVEQLNAALRSLGGAFEYLTPEQTFEALDYAPRDNPRRPVAEGPHYSAYRLFINDKWRWRDRTTLVNDTRTATNIMDQFEQDPIYGARLTDDALYVITER